MKKFFYHIFIFLVISCSKNPSDEIVQFSEEKYGENFTEENIDLSKVFHFKWKEIYIFPPVTYPDYIEKEIGFKYSGGIVPDDNYLFLFVYKKKIIKKYLVHNTQKKIGFSNDTMNVYKINVEKSKYRIKKIGTDNYWLYKE